MISWFRQSACLATVPTLAQSFVNIRPTKTGLATASGFHFLVDSPSFRSFVRSLLEKTTPGSIIDRLRQHPTGKPFNIQVLTKIKP